MKFKVLFVAAVLLSAWAGTAGAMCNQSSSYCATCEENPITGTVRCYYSNFSGGCSCSQGPRGSWCIEFDYCFPD